VSNLLIVYIVVIGGVFIFMTSRGNRKRRAQADLLQSALVIGAVVRTIGGLVGEVAAITDEHVIVETTPGVKLKFVKSAVAGVVAPEEPELGAYAEPTDPEEPAASGEADGAARPEPAEPADETPEHKAESAAPKAPEVVTEPAKH
jgi:preprotein translocase subunit YajC